MVGNSITNCDDVIRYNHPIRNTFENNRPIIEECILLSYDISSILVQNDNKNNFFEPFQQVS